MVKIIIFDLGGVILKHSHTLIPDILSKMFSISKVDAASSWKEYRVKLLKGELSSEQFLKELQKKFGTHQALSELLKTWGDLYRKNAEIDRNVLNFVTQLKRRHKVYLLTDTIEVHDRYNKTRSIYDTFTGVFKSFEEKLAKADGKAFFLHVLKKINAKPEECVFIDDMSEQVVTAERLGINGIIFRDLLQLKKDLAKLDIIV